MGSAKQQAAKKPAKRRPSKAHREAHAHVERAHRALGHGMQAVGRLHGDALNGGATEAERSRRLSTALGAGERASRALLELRNALRALDGVDVTPVPASVPKAAPNPKKTTATKPAKKAARR